MPTIEIPKIVSADLDRHRWYCILTTTYDNGTSDVKVIGVQQGGDGLGIYDSVEEWEDANL